jgi:hypothetical protein
MWGENGFMLVITVALTAAISWFGWELGQRYGGMLDAPRPVPREIPASPQAQQRAMSDPAAYYQQQQYSNDPDMPRFLHSVDTPGTRHDNNTTKTENTTIIVKGGRKANSALDEALGRLNQHIAAAS